MVKASKAPILAVDLPSGCLPTRLPQRCRTFLSADAGDYITAPKPRTFWH